MEKLHELHDTGEWDLLVIDTPPTRSALDFLDAPKRMTSFLEGRLLRRCSSRRCRPARATCAFLNAGATTFMKVAGQGHRHGPAQRPRRLLPQLRGHVRGLQGARRPGPRPAPAPVVAVRGRHLAAAATAAGGPLLPRPARAGGPAPGRRGRQPDHTRCPRPRPASTTCARPPTGSTRTDSDDDRAVAAACGCSPTSPGWRAANAGTSRPRCSDGRSAPWSRCRCCAPTSTTWRDWTRSPTPWSPPARPTDHDLTGPLAPTVGTGR